MGRISIYLPSNNNFGKTHSFHSYGVDLFNEKQIHYSIHADRIEFREVIISDKKNIIKPVRKSTDRIFTLHNDYIIDGVYIISDDNYKDGILTIWFEDVIK